MAAMITFLAKGGPVMIPLLACSITGLAVVLERTLFWWRLRRVDAARRMLDLAAQGNWDEALHLGASSGCPVAKVLAAGIAHRNPAPAEAMGVAALKERDRLRRYLPALDTIITLSPLLGLLGTVTGMISAFGVMASGAINQPHAITGGVAEALIATATGLAIAIVTLVPYNYFSAKAERTLDAMERDGSHLELLLKEASR